MLSKLEKYLIRMVMFSLLVVVLAQGLMTQDPIRFYMSWSERMEGQTLPTPVSAPQTESAPAASIESPQALIGIAPVNYTNLPDAKILINGRERSTFARGQALLRVKAGDTVEVDASNYNFPIEFTVTSGSANLASPEKGEVFTANQSMVMIGKIIVK